MHMAHSLSRACEDFGERGAAGMSLPDVSAPGMAWFCFRVSEPAAVWRPVQYPSPALLLRLGSALLCRVPCWLLTRLTMENSSMSISYRKQTNISFKRHGVTGRKQLILWSTLFTGKQMDHLQNTLHQKEEKYLRCFSFYTSVQMLGSL